jgi:hypothetical protein
MNLIVKTFYFVLILGTFAQAQIIEGLEAVNHAASQNDRWWFLASQVLLLSFLAVVIKWLVSHIEEKDKRLEAKEVAHEIKIKKTEDAAKAEREDDRREFLDVIKQFDLAQVERTKQMAEISEQLRNLNVIVTNHDREMRQAHQVETRSLVNAELTRLGLSPKSFDPS